MFPFVAASAVVPSLLLIWYFHARDLNKEPARVLWATFGLGVATVVPVLLVALPLAHVTAQLTAGGARGVVDAVVTAALPEEFFKFLVVVLYCSRHREFDEPMDGIVYGAVASLGFATLENILYVGSGGLGVAVMRALTAVPGHAFMGAIMGWYVGQARFGAPEARTGNLVRAYFIPVLLHAAYDAPLLALKESHGSPLAAASVLVTLGVLIFEWRWTVRLVRRLRAEQIAVFETRTAAAALVGPAGAVVVAASSTHAEVRKAYPPPAINPQGGGALGVVWLVLGGLLATFGGLMTLAVVIGLALGAGRPGGNANVGATIAGTLVIGVLPLALGLWLFRLGLRRWARPAAVVAAAP